ncbi:MAG: YlmH/Sll1252 family protein [Eubacteriales bacterium]
MAVTEQEYFFQNRILELGNRSYNQSIYTFTNFLDVTQLSLVHTLKKELGTISYRCFGGYSGAMRQMICFGSVESLGYDQPFPITCLIIEPVAIKFAETLTHSDYLGALMNLGIQRETLGDFVMEEKSCYLFCTDSIAPYLMEHVTKIRHTNVTCSVASNWPTESLTTLIPVTLLVSSKRIDGIIAKLANLSRSKANLLLQNKKVFLNGMCMENPSYILKKDDILVIRGIGKFVYTGVEQVTKKGNLKLELGHYK